MKTILFPTDFSKNAENALHYALEFALKLEAKLVLLNVVTLPYDLNLRVEEAVQSVEGFYDEKLRGVIADIQRNPRYASLSVQGITTGGSIVHTILSTATKIEASLIIMGTTGASGLSKLLFGTNTAEVIRQSEVPVLVIPEEAAYSDFKTIAFAIDYKEDDLKLLERAGKLASMLKTNLETVHVAPKYNLQEQILHNGLMQLTKDQSAYIFNEHRLIINKSFQAGMEAYLNENPQVLLAMAHYKRRFIESLLTKSISQEMAYHSKTPLLIFNAEK